MAVYPEIKFEVYVNGAWEEITNDVISSQEIQYGIMGNTPIDRVATTGTLKFALRNDSGCIGGVENYYSPGTVNAKAGWRNGIPVRLKIVYQDTFTKFRGHITDISLNPKDKKVDVLVADWMDFTSEFPLVAPSIEYDKNISDVVQAVVSGMVIKPINTVYNHGQDTFPTIFDTVKESTKAMSEFQKVALSELGYIYIRRDKEDGETLVVEGRHARTGDSNIKLISQEEGFLLLEDGDYLLLEDGSKIILTEGVDALFDNSMISADISYGDNLINRVSAKVYPRSFDTVDTVLFSLNSPIYLNAGETKSNIRGTYRDETSGANKVNGKDMITPLFGTDYQMWSNSNGAGTALTVYLNVTAQYGSEGVIYTLTNTGSIGGYVTKLQARGKAIYLYDPIEYIVEDTASINSFGYSQLSLDMKYQESLSSSSSIANKILSQETDPRTIIKRVDFIANTDDFLMDAFLQLDIGSLIKIKENKTGVESFYHIQGIKFTINQGGIIRFSWILKEALLATAAYWRLGIPGKSELGVTTRLTY